MPWCYVYDDLNGYYASPSNESIIVHRESESQRSTLGFKKLPNQANKLKSLLVRQKHPILQKSNACHYCKLVSSTQIMAIQQ